MGPMNSARITPALILAIQQLVLDHGMLKEFNYSAHTRLRNKGTLLCNLNVLQSPSVKYMSPSNGGAAWETIPSLTGA